MVLPDHFSQGDSNLVRYVRRVVTVCFLLGVTEKTKKFTVVYVPIAVVIEAIEKLLLNFKANVEIHILQCPRKILAAYVPALVGVHHFKNVPKISCHPRVYGL